MTASSNALRHGDARPGRVARLHNIWRGILKRCNAEAAAPHPRYAGRGIRVCAEWLRYENFKSWALGHGYRDDLTIERLDNDRGYEPDNCRWATRREQAGNRRSSTFIEHAGRRLIVADWARLTGISPSAILQRIHALGWSPSKAITTPLRADLRRLTDHN